MFTFKRSTFYTIIQWNCYKHLSHLCPGDYCRKSTAKLIHCWPHNLTAKTGSLQAPQSRQQMLLRCIRHAFGSECYFAAADTLSAANAKCAAGNSISAANHTSTIDNTTSAANLIHCGQHNSASTTCFTADNTMRQRTPDSPWTIESGSETCFVAENTIRQRTPNSLRTTEFDSETCFAANNTIRQGKPV